jgi:hypothetical protein
MERRDEENRWAELRAQQRWTEEEARWAVAAWAASGETLVSFGEAHGVHPERLRRWRERLGVTQTEKSTAGREAAPAVALVPVAVRPPTLPMMVGNEGAVVVVVGGARIVINDGAATSPDWVARLVAQLSTGVVS